MFEFRKVIFLAFLPLASSCVAVDGKIEDYDDVVKKVTSAVESGDYGKAYDLTYPFAESGDPEAQFSLGLFLGWGFGHDSENPSEQEREQRSLLWIKKAAVQGHDKATKLMSDAYAHGWYGLSKDEQLSLCWKEANNNPIKAKECNRKASD